MKIGIIDGSVFIDGKAIRNVEEYYVSKDTLTLVIKIDKESEVAIAHDGDLVVDTVVAGHQCGKDLYEMLKKVKNNGNSKCELGVRKGPHG